MYIELGTRPPREADCVTEFSSASDLRSLTDKDLENREKNRSMRRPGGESGGDLEMAENRPYLGTFTSNLISVFISAGTNPSSPFFRG